MATCEEVTRLKSESMDSKLSLRQKFSIKFHVIFCQWCRKYGKQLDMIRQAAQKFKDKTDDFEREPRLKISSDTKERLKNLIKD